MEKILWVKFGWSEFYRGGPVNGNFAFLNEKRAKINERRGHEAFNFNQGPDGTYFCYVPPQRKQFPPWNKDRHGWTVICLAKNPKYKGIHVVGWYENATLYGDWLDPPADMVRKRGGATHPAYDWSYCISSKTVYFVPPKYRTIPFSHPAVRQGKFSFLVGPDVQSTDNKRRVLALLKGRLKALATKAIKNPSERNCPDPGIDAGDPLKAFGTPEHRKKVEKAAEVAVITHYKKKGFDHVRVTHLACGYDFIFAKGKAEIHVEVKGTSGSVPQFFLTGNEHTNGMMTNVAWHLAMVTDALSDDPKIKIYRAKQVQKIFELTLYVFRGTLIPK